MSRRRYVSTEISLDARINRLATEHGDFAALCYTWMIPHAEDDGSITADPEEILFRVFPGRRDKIPQDIAAAIDGMLALNLVFRDDRRLLFPADAFYRYQSYIPGEKRKTARNADVQRRTAKNASSPSPSPSPKEDIAASKKRSQRLLIDKDPRVKEFKTWFASAYAERFKAPYHVNHGKHGQLVKDLLRTFDLAELQRRAVLLWESADKFISGTDRGIGILHHQINNLKSASRMPTRREMPA